MSALSVNLRSLDEKVKFGAAARGNPEIVVTGKVESVDGSRVVVNTEATQNDTKLIKNAKAELDLEP